MYNITYMPLVIDTDGCLFWIYKINRGRQKDFRLLSLKKEKNLLFPSITKEYISITENLENTEKQKKDK